MTPDNYLTFTIFIVPTVLLATAMEMHDLVVEDCVEKYHLGVLIKIESISHLHDGYAIITLHSYS